jgi:MinD-like ATPase involved in chromosome partitioning or flagellar assembly
VLIAVSSAKGSPGVTTTATALGGIWPHDVVLADLDPAGGDIALRHRDPSGRPLDPERGLLSLAAAARRGLAEGELYEHVQRVDGGLDVIAGVARPEQITGIGPVWPTLGTTLRQSPLDVIADCGRVSPGTPVMPVLSAADALVFVVRPTVEGYAHLRERLRWLADPLQFGHTGGIPVGVVVVAPSSDSKSAHDLDRLLQHDGLRVSVLGRIADDPKAAGALAGRWSRSIDRSLLIRSAREVAASVHALAAGRLRTTTGG